MSHNYNRTILSSTYTVFVRKSIPIVAYRKYRVRKSRFNGPNGFPLRSASEVSSFLLLTYLVLYVETVLSEPENYGCLPNGLVAQEDYLVLHLHGSACFALDTSVCHIYFLLLQNFTIVH